MARIVHVSFFVCLALAAAASAAAGDAYRVVALADLAIEGAWPQDGSVTRWDLGALGAVTAALDGAGEAYVDSDGDDTGGGEFQRAHGRLCVRAPAGAAPTGVITVPAGDHGVLLRFTAPAEDGGDAARTAFLRARERRYRALEREGLPGTAWFRQQAGAAARAVGDRDDGEAAPRWRRVDVDDTFDLFNGGRALAENLQLDAQLGARRDGDAAREDTAIAGIEGISVAAIDWAPLVKDLKPEGDPLAALIPYDQHALLFPSFAALVAVLDRADAIATPLVEALGDRAEDASTRALYQRQLCLEVTDLARTFGPAVVDSAAITGSDPYLRMGSDIAILFRPKQRDALVAFIAAKHAAAAQAGAHAVRGEAGGVAWSGVVTDDRGVSSYLATIGDAVVVTNSTAQLARLAATAAGGRSLAGEPEYTFFRDRYRRGGDESALLVISDATIRRWCSPAWRIADSRRVRALAALARLHAARVAGDDAVEAPSELGTVDFAADGPRSARYGTLAFMTPIIEDVPTRCTAAEAASYQRFRDGYQQRWRGWFDPIALRVAVAADGAVDSDLSVMPLIASSDYREVMEVAGSATIAPGAGDPHDGTLLHVALAVDRTSQPVRQLGQMATGYAPGLGIDVLGWLGSSVSVYADADPFWTEWLAAPRRDAFWQEHLGRLPVAATLEVGDALKLAAFLTGLRGFVDQSAPGLTAWETRTHRDKPYVRVAQVAEAGEAAYALYYAATPKRLIVTLDEDVVKRALDRQIDGVQPATPWLGEQLCLRAGTTAVAGIEALKGGLVESLQRRSWSNLPILNEWRRRFPDEDPVAAHERLWHARLVCPGGGTYRWNERWRTMESSVFGHPAEPKQPSRLTLVPGMAAVDCGVAFQRGGLRARARLTPGEAAIDLPPPPRDEDEASSDPASPDAEPAPTPPAPAGANEEVHVLADGETLYSVAQSYHVELSWLIKRNVLTQPAKPGDRLIVPKR